MKKSILLLVILWAVCPTRIHAAPSASEARNLVDRYVHAFRADDELTMDAVFDRITGDPALHALVKEQHPGEYVLINLRSILRRIDEMDRRYGNGSHEPSSGTIVPDTLMVTTSSVTDHARTLRGKADNQRIVSHFPNRHLTPNHFRTAFTSNNRIRRTNGGTVRSYSNQDRARNQSNQERLRRR